MAGPTTGQLWPRGGGAVDGGEDAVTSVNGFTGDVILDANSVGADPIGTSGNAMTQHLNTTDPHSQYLTQAEGDARYAAVGGGGAPSGPAGGDLSGTYPNPQIAAGTIVNADINASAAIATSKISGLDTALAGAVPKSLVDAKGDLLVGTANDTVARLGVGTNGQALTADSASAGGMKWAAVANNANVVQVASFADVTVPPPAGTLVILTP